MNNNLEKNICIEPELISSRFDLPQDKSDTGVRKLLEGGELPLEKVLVESDAPFMYPNTRASKLPQHVKSGITERSQLFLHRSVESFASYLKWMHQRFYLKKKHTHFVNRENNESCVYFSPHPDIAHFNETNRVVCRQSLR